MTDPTTEAGRALLRTLTRVVRLAQVRAGIEEYGAAERAAGREEERERIRPDLLNFVTGLLFSEGTKMDEARAAADEMVTLILDAPAEESLAALPAACCCIEGNDIMLTTCATNDCPEHGASEADRLLVALVVAVDSVPWNIPVPWARGDGATGPIPTAVAAARAYLARKGLA